MMLAADKFERVQANRGWVIFEATGSLGKIYSGQRRRLLYHAFPSDYQEPGTFSAKSNQCIVA